MDIRNDLIKQKEEAYGDFQSKLMPTVDRERILGIRVPVLRKYAKHCMKEWILEELQRGFLRKLPHQYYDENMLHGLLLAEMKDFSLCMEEVERFLPYIDNWAVCDILSPKVFKKDRKALLKKIKVWVSSKDTYVCRFGVGMLMTHFLDEDFTPEILEIPAKIRSEEYYINMMIAWFFATALAKQWEDTIPYLEGKKMEKWVHNKTVQKARESFRISKEQKEYLKKLKQ